MVVSAIKDLIAKSNQIAKKIFFYDYGNGIYNFKRTAFFKIIVNGI